MNMKEKLLLLFLFIVTIISAQPIGVVLPLSGIQDNPTSKPIVYYSVHFNEPIAGFTESDIDLSVSVPGTSAGAGNAFILPSPTIQTQDFIIGVDGMFTNGLISVTIPANSVASLSEGLGNYQTNTSSITYIPPSLAFSTYLGNTVNYTQNVQYEHISFIPSGVCEFSRFNTLGEALAEDYKALRYVNNTPSGVCVGVRVGKDGTPLQFNIFNDNLPTDLSTTLQNWVGGSDDNNITPFVFDGRYVTSSYAFINPGQIFYVMAKTNSSDFWITIEGLPQSSLNYLGNDDFSIQNKFTISPNPSNGFFNITSEESIQSVKVYNSLGQKVFQGNQTQIDISNQPKGIYFVDIVANNQKSTQKIILN